MSVDLLIKFPDKSDRLSLFRDIDEIRQSFDSNILEYSKKHLPANELPDYIITITSVDEGEKLSNRLKSFSPNLAIELFDYSLN